jgi:hypothetical protein
MMMWVRVLCCDVFHTCAAFNANVCELLCDSCFTRLTAVLRPTDFAASTGWSAASVYEPLPEYLHQYMAEFMEPQNRLLFSLLGRNFTGEW